MDYKDTLNLPRTDFPMRANLPEREPAMLQRWAAEKIDRKIYARNASAPRFVLHDGPPYANGNIHQGHILNKVLKDIVAKYQNLAGRLCDFVPGWDCHGLPIELMVDKQLGPKKREMSTVQFRRECRKYAEKYVAIQRDEFRRLGVFARWDEPYLTMDYGYEAIIVRELSKFAARGALYRKKRPVHWCPKDATALAEAEVEYEEHTSPSIYVAMKLVESLGRIAPALEGRHGAVAIWTTTPWTLPANLAVAVHPEFTYVVYDLGAPGTVIVAKELLARFLADCAPDQLITSTALGTDPAAALVDPKRILAYADGKALEGLTYHHPFLERTSPVILGEHVTLEAGTGLVHTAPGHGHEDYEVGHKYGLEVLAPVDNRGRFTAEAGLEGLAGLNVFEANPKIVERLHAAGALLNPRGETVTHSYPHCWRCHGPVIFRATDQWFISLDNQDLRQKALREIDRVKWIPRWGRERIWAMMQTRPDWCISRQRAWGVPIAVFYCEQCNEPLVDAKVMEAVASRFQQSGADAWFEHAAAELIPAGTRCACGNGSFRKETDILDVWFDSGVSFAAVAEQRPNLGAPVDLYLEGSDQHRGWFNSSLICAVGTRDQAPYRQVLTHGFVVDGQGKKMSKSAGNYVPPENILKKYGAEILRLWVAAEDYTDDIRLSDEILTRLADAYRKIRNTIRYALSNLYDYDPGRDDPGPAALTSLDRWALDRLGEYTRKVRRAYDEYQFHLVYHSTIDFCAVDLSAFYFDVLKDRLYASGARTPARRAAQSVLYRIACDLLRLIAPVISFTAEEAWSMLPGARAESVFLAGLPAGDTTPDEALAMRFARLLDVRAGVQKELEQARAQKIIGSSLEARVTLSAQGEMLHFLESARAELPTLLIVSQVDLADAAVPDKPFAVQVSPARGQKCARCWVYSEEVGKDPIHPLLCGRCAKVVGR